MLFNKKKSKILFVLIISLRKKKGISFSRERKYFKRGDQIFKLAHITIYFLILSSIS